MKLIVFLLVALFVAVCFLAIIGLLKRVMQGFVTLAVVVLRVLAGTAAVAFIALALARSGWLSDDEAVFWGIISTVCVVVYLAFRPAASEAVPERLSRRAKVRKINPTPLWEASNHASEFQPLSSRKGFWRRSAASNDARIKHVLDHLRVVVPNERRSLDFSGDAVLHFWAHTSQILDAEVIDLRGTILLWLTGSERSLSQAGVSRAQHMLQCERLVQSLEATAVKCRALLTRRGDEDADFCKAQTDYMGIL